MIFAELRYDQPYADVHAALADLLGRHFADVRSGLQSDSWIWVLEAGRKVAVDTFTSMHHQVNRTEPSPLVERVLAILETRYALLRRDPPEFEGHEGPDLDC